MNHYSKGFTYFICCVSAMGGLLFGYDWVVIGGAKPFYELYFGIADSPLLQGVAMSTALVGCLVGAMIAGAAADRWGRKPLLMTSAVLFTVSAIGTGLFNDFTLFNIARFVGGMGIGVASALAPMYIAEVSPAEIRGRMVSLNQMTIVLGILSAQIVNMLLARDTSVAESMAWNLEWGWRWMFWAETLPAALFLLMSFFIPESPVYLQFRAATTSQHAGQEGRLKELFQRQYGRVWLGDSRFPAVVWHECHLQLCAGDFRRCRFRCRRYVHQYCDYRYCQRPVYVCGTLHHREVGPAYADAPRCRRAGTDLPDVGHLLLLRSEGRDDGGTRCSSHLGLCHDAGACHLDAPGRNLPQPYPRCRDGYLYLRPLGRLLHADVLLPVDECSLGLKWLFLDLQRHLHLLLCLPVPPLSRDEG